MTCASRHVTRLFGWRRYRRLHNAIRRVDDGHIIFFEPTVPPPPPPPLRSSTRNPCPFASAPLSRLCCRCWSASCRWRTRIAAVYSQLSCIAVDVAHKPSLHTRAHAKQRVPRLHMQGLTKGREDPYTTTARRCRSTRTRALHALHHNRISALNCIHEGTALRRLLTVSQRARGCAIMLMTATWT